MRGENLHYHFFYSIFLYCKKKYIFAMLLNLNWQNESDVKKD